MKKIIITLLALFSLCVSGCATQNDSILAGGILGGWAGSALTRGSPVGTIAGAVGGALIGKDMHDRDCDGRRPCGRAHKVYYIED